MPWTSRLGKYKYGKFAVVNDLTNIMSAAEERKKQVCLVIMRPDVKVEDDIDIVEVNCHAGDHLSLNQKKQPKLLPQ